MNHAQFWGGAAAAPYEIEHSLRFDGSSKLSRTPSSAGSTTTWTLSYWIKIGDVTAEQAILSANPSAGGYTATWFSAGATSRLKINQYNHPTNVYSKCPTPVYRDPSAWFHVVVVFDSTNATADDRVRFYVNGVRQTDFSDDGSSVGGTTNPSQNQASGVNHNAIHYIGSQYNGTYAFAESYLAEMHLLDGTAVTDADDFGEYDSNGVWRPIEVSGVTYGTNGFYLKFDPTATNGIGHDHSGNGNHWTANGFFNEIGTPDYNDNWIGSTSGSIYSGSWENVFDGNASVSSSFVYVYNQTSTLTFSTALSGVIEVLASNGSSVSGSGTMQVSLSDGSTYNVANVTRVNTPFYSFGSKSNITSITITSSGGGNHGTILGAIRVDGDLLVNNSAKAGYDNFIDTPTNNHATFNVIDHQIGSATFSEGNLKVTTTSSGNARAVSTIRPTSGKWYCEFTVHDATRFSVGVENGDRESSAQGGASTNSVIVFYNRSAYFNGSATANYLDATISNEDIIQVALDLDNNAVYVGRNNTWGNSATASEIASGTTTNSLSAFVSSTNMLTGDVGVFVEDNSGSGSMTATANFGQRDFEYTPPTGFVALNTSNLPAPDVKDGSEYFSTTLYTGVSGSQSVDAGMATDLAWIKSRSTNQSHSLTDSARGNDLVLQANETGGDTSGDIELTSTGVTIGDNNALRGASGVSYVLWSWKEGATQGFDIVTYTGNGFGASTPSTQTISHSLGVKPAMILVKNRSRATDWNMYHKALGATKGLEGINDNNQKFDNANYWNDTEPTSTVFSVGTDTSTNRDGDNFVAYCFAEVEGYSAFKEFLGNGSTDGPFVHLGFRPAFIIIKKHNSEGDWIIKDTLRPTYNVNDKDLRTNVNNAEATSSARNVDILSNGFKLRTSDGDYNNSGDSYIVIAFAENPFGGDGVSPVTAR